MLGVGHKTSTSHGYISPLQLRVSCDVWKEREIKYNYQYSIHDDSSFKTVLFICTYDSHTHCWSKLY